MTASPGFANPGAGDLHLASGSPAVDTAMNVGYGTDFDGGRVPHDGNGDGSRRRSGRFRAGCADGARRDTGADPRSSTASHRTTNMPPTPAPTPVPTPPPAPVAARNGPVTASAETAAVPHGGDAADEPAIWVNAVTRRFRPLLVPTNWAAWALRPGRRQRLRLFRHCPTMWTCVMASTSAGPSSMW